MEGGVDDLLEHLCQYHFQVFEGLSLPFFESPFLIFCLLLRLSYRCYGDFVILSHLLEVSPLFTREEGEGLFRQDVAGVDVQGELDVYYLTQLVNDIKLEVP